MRAVRHTEAGIEVLEVPDPHDPGLRLAPASAGICGSDLHMLQWGPMPFTLGHEVGGRLDDGTPVGVRWPVARLASLPVGVCLARRSAAHDRTRAPTGP